MDEADENFFVNISNVLLGARPLIVTDSQAEGKILNDDLSISIEDAPAVIEGNSGQTDAVFKIKLSAPSTHPVTVHYRTQDGTAVSSGNAPDFTAIGDAVVTFAPGETEKLVSVKVQGDQNFDLANTFTVLLSQPEGAKILDGDALGTITDDDAKPVFSISDVTRLENADAPGNATSTAFTFHITLSAASDETVEVSATTFDGTAIGGQDFTAINGQRITFAPGETDKTVVVTVQNDSAFETDEQFTLQLHNPLHATFGAKTAGTGTIQADNDAAPTLKVTGSSILEGDNGEKFLNFTVTRTGATGAPIKFKASAIIDGTDDATAGVDFGVLAPDEITLEATESSKTVSVRIFGDTAIEGDETFTLAITDLVNATLAAEADGKAKGTILDDDAHVRLAPLTTSLPEGSSGQSDMIFTVSLSGPAAKAMTITYTTAAGTALAGTDFVTPAVLSIVIPAGASTGEIRVPIIGDSTAEDNETLTVTLTGATNGVLEAEDLTATGTILNDDAALSISDARVLEGQSGTRDMVFTVTLKDASVFPVTVHYTTQTPAANAATIGVDFGTQGQTAIAGDLTFLPGETTKTIVIPIIGDVLFEGDEKINVVLSDARANGVSISGLLDGEGVGTITDDDALLSISDVTVEEGDTGTKTAVFTVSLLPTGITGEVTVKVSTLDGTATSTGANPDFVAKTETLVFSPGQTTKTFSVVINGDLVPEALSEMFTVALSDSTGATIVDGEGVGTITTLTGQPAPNQTLDDPLPSISIGDATIVEGNSGTKQLEFTVSLTQASSAPVTFSLASTNGTADGTDFGILAGATFTIPAGEKTLKVSIPIFGDTTDEADETFTLTLTNAKTNIVGADRTLFISDVSATGTILNDESTVSIGDTSVVEGNAGTSTLFVPVSIPSAVGHDVKVTFTVAAGTATAGTDFVVPTVLTATIPAGQTTVNIPITVNGDTTYENDEKLTVTLTSATGALLGTTTATGTITNDDAAPVVTIADSNADKPGEVSVNEGTAAVFTVKLAAKAERDITIRYVTVDGTAEGDDYAQSTLEKTLVIPAGQTEAQISIATTQDTRDELDETFQIRLLADPANGLAIDTLGTATINADQSDLSSLSIADAKIVEGNSGTQKLVFVVSRTGNSVLLPVTVNFTTADGTAKVGGGDYLTNNGTLTFAPGERTKTIEIDVFGDTVNEVDETIFVTLSNPTGAKLGDSVGLGTIQNDEVSYELSPTGTVTVVEENGTTQQFAVFNVIRTGAVGSLTLPGTVFFTTEAPTTGVAATAGADYTATSGTISFSAGGANDTTQTATQQIRVPIIGDKLLEGDETFVVRLTSGVHGILSANDRATVTIDDNDDAPELRPKVVIEKASITEGASGSSKNLSFIVKLVDANGTTPLAAAGDIEITYSTVNGTATEGSDFTGATDLKLIIPAGQTQGIILIPILGDDLDEADETFSVNLASPGKLTVPGVATPFDVSILTGTAIGTITNDDLSVTVTQLDAPEGNTDGTRTFTVKLSQASQHEVKLKYRTQEGTATAGDDFIAVPTATEITIPANVTEFTFTVGIVGDLFAEANESFTVLFSDATNAQLSTTSLTALIFNDDATPSLTIGDASVVEGDNGTLNMVFTVTLAGATREAVTVDFATSDGTAKAGGVVPDYITKSGSLKFDPTATGGVTKQIIVPIVGDNWKEATETFTVALSNARLGSSATGVNLTDGTATGEIIDDGDQTLGVFVTETRAVEGGVLAFNVQTTAPTTSALTFKASTRTGTANSSDFTAISDQSFTIAAGTSSVNVPVQTRADTTFELTEFLFLDVSDIPAGAQAVAGSGGTVSARGYVLADDLQRVSDREFNYVDVDGDIVNVRFSKGSLAIPVGGVLESNDLRFVASGTLGGRFLELINLSDDGFEFEGVNITVRAEPQVLASGEILGDGRGDVGLLFAAVPEGNLFQFVNGVSLGKVQIDGDLGRLFAGSTQRPAGVSLLDVGSFGVRTQDSNSPASGNSIVLGPIGKMVVHGNVGSSLSVIGDSFTLPIPSGKVGRIGSLIIEGALKGGSTQDSGRISFTGGIGTAVIGSIEGGTGESSGSLQSFDNRFVTSIGSLTVTRGITGGNGENSGFVEANRISSLTIGKKANRTSDPDIIGNITGGSGQQSGLVLVGTSMGSVFIHGDVVGGAGSDSGKISVQQKIGKTVVTGDVKGGAGSGSGAFSVGQFSTVTIEGNVTGGAGANSGALTSSGFSGDDGPALAGDIAKVTIGKSGTENGNITGGAGQGSGGVFTNGKVSQLLVYGDITGGKGNFSGGLAISGVLSKATVNGDLIGGNATGGDSASLVGSGFISASTIANLVIKGNVQSGTTDGGDLAGSGAIRAIEKIGKLRVDGNVTGNNDVAAIISARDGIGTLLFGGNVAFAEILAGYALSNSASQPRGTLTNAGAGISSVTINGSMKASSIVAGVFAGADGQFGTVDDDEESNGGTSAPSNQDLVARIASVVIGSVDIPTGDAANKTYGIVAEEVASVKVTGVAVALQKGDDNDRLVPVGGAATKLNVHET